MVPGNGLKGKAVKIRCSPATVMGYENFNSHFSEMNGKAKLVGLMPRVRKPAISSEN